jgi:hypothetical protein
MALFGKRVSMLEVQNRALIKTARERADRIEELVDSGDHKKRHPGSRQSKEAESASTDMNESCSN